LGSGIEPSGFNAKGVLGYFILSMENQETQVILVMQN
jgi:hypothetical protein